ncbi:hypothetical protein K493DRAFT_306404 [Basidiobolus meristosporus CBS 931.73]|uniref:p53 and DNA damage-regulated protein 1 n=1 Tax=Basidiobolus meristosporus CBS 931.73 TaxID=1314790 RepID=A0A1Y1XTU5_9FUNG|nr:hypothetical protein K493DRAFT_306404 [Basidiobolus meristosporus CBS 931.73]|eukprot:ORX88714.1 hypothetical protein K493DRAFT_306404 [Basidiobolus meristosporus CBS 931.73]
MSFDIVKQQAEREQLAEDILTDRQLIIDYDRRRNTNREALNNLKKAPAPKKVWMNLGDMFVKFETEKVKDLIRQDQDKLDSEINEIRDGLKVKARQLDVLEGGDGTKTAGFDLKSVSGEELYGITKAK